MMVVQETTLCSLTIPLQSLLDTGLCPECHWHSSYLVEGEPSLAKVFQRGADMIDGVVSFIT